MNQNQKLTVTLVAVTVALVGVLVGILSYFRKKAIEFDESWDFGCGYDGDDYDNPFEDCSCCSTEDEDFDDSILVEENNNG